MGWPCNKDFQQQISKMNLGKKSWTKKACWKAEEYRGRQSAEGCHQIVWKDATKLSGRMPSNCSICKNVVQQQEIGVIEGRNL